MEKYEQCFATPYDRCCYSVLEPLTSSPRWLLISKEGEGASPTREEIVGHKLRSNKSRTNLTK